MTVVTQFKKIMCSILIMGLLFSTSIASAGNTSQITILLNGKPFIAKDSNGKELNALIKNGITYLPLRAISEALDIPVKWENSISSVILGAKMPSHAVKDSKMSIYLNGKIFNATDGNGKLINPLSINGITYLPLRAISEALNIPVKWDSVNKIVTLGTGKKIEKIVLEGKYYEGEVKGDDANGEGCLYLDNGTLIYVGGWLDGLFHGNGTEYYKNGKIQYKSEFFEGQRQGLGRHYFKNGNIWYDGEWVNDNSHGKGELYSEEGYLVYKGDFSLNERHGIGTGYYSSGNKIYFGDYKNDTQNGRGILYYEDGTVWYIGDWKDGDVHGKGSEYYEDGSLMYKGDYKEGKRHGLGILYNEDGTVQHEGKFENDLPVK